MTIGEIALIVKSQGVCWAAYADCETCKQPAGARCVSSRGARLLYMYIPHKGRKHTGPAGTPLYALPFFVRIGDYVLRIRLEDDIWQSAWLAVDDISRRRTTYNGPNGDEYVFTFKDPGLYTPQAGFRPHRRISTIIRPGR